MAGFSTYLGNAVLNWMRGTAMPTAPTGLWVSLWNGDPQSGGTEITTTIRTAGRVSAAFSASTAKSIANTALVDFGAAAGAAASVTHFGVHDAASSGNLLGSGSLTSGSGAVGASTAVSFAIGALVVTD